MHRKESLRMRGIAAAVLIVLTGYPYVVLADSKRIPPDIDPNLVADAGLTRYVARDAITLDGTDSYAPQEYGELTYRWRQIAGPSIIIEDANSATPIVGGFIQNSSVQTCRFELNIGCSDRVSEPDTVDVVIVPDFGESNLLLANEWFDPDKPTFIFFNGGSTCSDGAGGVIDDHEWLSRVNSIGFTSYQPDIGSDPRTFYHYGDMIIVFLSSVVKNYDQPIQSAGFSAGGTPALDIGIRLNQTYQDARFALNCVTLIDGGFCLGRRGNPHDYVSQYLGSPVAGEPCWVQNYMAGNKTYYLSGNVLNVYTDLSHGGMASWYFNSFDNPDMNMYNGGVVAGAYWSVMGPGASLRLASTPEGQTYFFRWYGSETSGYMDFYNQSLYPARLPEPPELAKPVYRDDDRGYVLTCNRSENAVGYELLVGADPHCVADYEVICDETAPPNESVRPLLFDGERCWWTVRARDQYGSTIHAVPDSIKPTPRILDLSDDGLVDFKDFALLARHWAEEESSVDLAPGPLGDGNVDIRDVAVIAGYWLADDLRCMAHWKLDEDAGAIAHESMAANHGQLHGAPTWHPSAGKLGGAVEFDGINDYVSSDFLLNPADGPFSVFAWVKAGSTQGVVISQTDSGENDSNWLATDTSGTLMTNIKRPGRGGSSPLISESNVTDNDWHHIGFVFDGYYRRLYSDGVEVAVDFQLVAGIVGADGGLHIGVDSSLSPQSFWAGLIDDVRIYDYAITP